MTLRLVLVSLVAGLGISLPGWPMLERWVASSQKWMNHRLAEWDYRQSDEENYIVIHDLLKVEMERARMARLTKRMANLQAANRQTPPPTAVRPTLGSPVSGVVRTVSLDDSARAVRNAVALIPLPLEMRPASLEPQVETGAAPASFEPLVVGERLQVGTAFELNHRHEGIGILPRVVVRPAATPAPQPVDLIAAAVDRFGAPALRSIRVLGDGMRTVAARELAARDAVALELAAREAAAQFEALGNADDLYFADAPAAPEPAPVSEIVAQAAVEPSGFEVMEHSENLYFADRLVTAASAPASEPASVSESEPIADAAPATVATVVQVVIPDDPFAPADPTAAGEPQSTRQAGVAEPVEKTDAAAGPEVVVRTVQNVELHRPGVSRAVRLTRDALLAWANVLAEPSLMAAGPTSTANR